MPSVAADLLHGGRPVMSWPVGLGVSVCPLSPQEVYAGVGNARICLSLVLSQPPQWEAFSEALGPLASPPVKRDGHNEESSVSMGTLLGASSLNFIFLNFKI